MLAHSILPLRRKDASHWQDPTTNCSTYSAIFNCPTMHRVCTLEHVWCPVVWSWHRVANSLSRHFLLHLTHSPQSVLSAGEQTAVMRGHAHKTSTCTDVPPHLLDLSSVHGLRGPYVKLCEVLWSRCDSHTHRQADIHKMARLAGNKADEYNHEYTVTTYEATGEKHFLKPELKSNKTIFLGHTG